MDLPELRSFVGSFLDNDDLMSCVRVSKLWHESFIPLLYAKARGPQLCKHWTAFEPRLCHVRDLQFSYFTDTDKLNSILENCTRLRTLMSDSVSTKIFRTRSTYNYWKSCWRTVLD